MKRLVLVSSLLAASCSNAATAARRSALDSTLVAAYSFDDGAGAVLHDSTANHLDGTLSNQTWTTGKYGGALSFDDGLVTVPDNNLLDLNALTLSAWVYPTDEWTYWQQVAAKDRVGGVAYGLYLWDSTKPRARITSGSTVYDLAAGTKPPVNQWTYLAFTYDGATMRVYKSSGGTLALAGSKAVNKAVVATSLPFRIGGNGYDGSFYTGRLDDLRVYSRALSLAELATDMSTPIGGAGGGTGSGGASGAGGGAGAGGSAGASGSGGGAGSGGTAGDAGAAGGGSGASGSSGATGSGGAPVLGAHASAFLPVGSGSNLLTAPPITTTTGSVVVVGVARGNSQGFGQAGAIPSDNLGNTFPQLGTVHPFAHPWEEGGTALYALVGAVGGAGEQLRTLSGMATNGNYDETTLVAAEVLNGARVQDVQFNVVVQDNSFSIPVTSASVTTTGPATIVAFWYGDAIIPPSGCTVSTNNGFQVVEAVLTPGSVAQAALAVKSVSAAGIYNVTWTANPPQGASMWMVAVQ